ncbi:zinc-ribbon domain-containing protein, partial [Litoreibacter sp.]|nr:zinc-ribbon domain-containing protein [Litoreibacter sp.]
MRLVCPNCDAEYEVDASLVPPEGRDVQCSNCNISWFQKPDQDEEAKDPQPAAQAVGLTPPRPATDPKALEIIHEEVARETRARQSEGSALETQTDLGLDTSHA